VLAICNPLENIKVKRHTNSIRYVMKESGELYGWRTIFKNMVWPRAARCREAVLGENTRNTRPHLRRAQTGK
jgi:hypothetical protein